MEFVHYGGWIGVDLFFVLSGFLIAGLLFREYNSSGSVDAVRFFIRRGFKIYPSFYVMTLTTLGILICFNIPFRWTRVLPFFAFFQNYLPESSLAESPNAWAIWGHTWSLAVEEHFYLAMPLLLGAMIALSKNKKAPFGMIPFICMLAAVVCFGLRIQKSSHPFVYWNDMTPSHVRVDTLFFGVLIAYYHTYRLGDFQKWFRFARPSVVCGAGICFLLPAFFFDYTVRFIYIAGLSLFYLGSGLVLAAILRMDYKDHWVLNGISVVGRYSYPIYLWHLPCKVLADYWNSIYHSGVLYLLSYGFLPLILGVAMSKGVEMPLLRWRDKIIPSRAAANGALSR